MSIRVIHLVAFVVVGTALLAGNLVRPLKAAAQFVGTSIHTDRSQYQVGDSIRICYSVLGPGPFAITDTQSDGAIRTLLSAFDDGTGGCFGGSVTPPTGTECLNITAAGGSAQSCFQVGGYGPPPPGPCIQIYPPPPGCGGGGSITTDQSQYPIGAPIRICYSVPGPGPVTITDHQADGSSHVVLSVYDDGTGWCFAATVTPPPGRECLSLDYASSLGTNSTQTCFQVLGAGSYGCSNPAQTVSLNDNFGTVSARVDQCFLLSLDAGDGWTVSVDDPSILACDRGSVSPDAQVSCTTLRVGNTTLHATGTPTCYPQCLRPSQEFQLFVIVQP